MDRPLASAGRRIPHDGFDDLVARTHRSRPFLDEQQVRRLVRAYGTRVERVLGPARLREELGPCWARSHGGRGALFDAAGMGADRG